MDLTGKHIWFHAGDCAMCDWMARFIARHDRFDRIRIGYMQSEFGRSELLRRGVSQAALDAGAADAPSSKTAELVADFGPPRERLLHHGRASPFITSQLGGFYGLLGRLGILLLDWVLDPPYRLVNRKRYAWFGKRDACAMSTPEMKARTIE